MTWKIWYGVNDMGNRIRKKLKNSSGESIAETLVAVLISAFALLMLAGTVNSASNLITKSQNSLKTYYKDYNDLADPGSGTLEAISVQEGADPVLSDTVNVKIIDSKIGNRKLVAYE